MLSDALPLHIKTHSFSDNSGTVFFNQVTGETLGVTLSAQQVEALLAGTGGQLNMTTYEQQALSSILNISFLNSGAMDG